MIFATVGEWQVAKRGEFCVAPREKTPGFTDEIDNRPGQKGRVLSYWIVFREEGQKPNRGGLAAVAGVTRVVFHALR